MADEVKIQLTTNIVTDRGVRVSDTKAFNVTMTGIGVSHHTQMVTDEEEPLINGLEESLNTVDDQGFYIIKHLDSHVEGMGAGWITVGKVGSCSTSSLKSQEACEGASPAGTWTDGVHVIKLLVGESCIFRGGEEELGVKANALTAQLEIIAIEN